MLKHLSSFICTCLQTIRVQQAGSRQKFSLFSSHGGMSVRQSADPLPQCSTGAAISVNIDKYIWNIRNQHGIRTVQIRPQHIGMLVTLQKHNDGWR